jgi:hypothetical protein|tara:strand:+ start:324 stop:521 length:198 start_codon:yes stop_codon:yes gene_type:complete
MSPQKRARQERAIERTKASILAYEELLAVLPRVDSDINFNPQDEKKRLMKKIERAKTTIKNTKII